MGKSFGLMLILIFLTSFVMILPVAVKAQPKTIIVPDNYPTIQVAIDNASPGDTIYVHRGIHAEHIIIDKPLLLIGEDKSTTIIDGNGTGTVLQITGDKVQVANFTIRNAGVSQWVGHGFPDSCIDVQDSTDVTIKNTILTNATVAIWSYASSNVSSYENSVSNTTTMGIVAYTCTNSSISDNFLQNCGLVGVHLDGNSVSCTIEDNSIANCGEGIDIEKSDENFVDQNTLLNNNVSIAFSEDTGNFVQHCMIENNSVGIGFVQSNGNTLCYNSFVDNGKQVVSDFYSNVLSANKWDNGREGNYWSDYLAKYPNATEVGSSGIGNTPYTIDDKNTDNYPLIRVVNISSTLTQSPAIPEFESGTILLLSTIMAVVTGLVVYYNKRKKLMSARRVYLN